MPCVGCQTSDLVFLMGLSQVSTVTSVTWSNVSVVEDTFLCKLATLSGAHLAHCQVHWDRKIMCECVCVHECVIDSMSPCQSLVVLFSSAGKLLASSQVSCWSCPLTQWLSRACVCVCVSKIFQKFLSYSHRSGIGRLSWAHSGTHTQTRLTQWFTHSRPIWCLGVGSNWDQEKNCISFMKLDNFRLIKCLNKLITLLHQLLYYPR